MATCPEQPLAGTVSAVKRASLLGLAILGVACSGDGDGNVGSSETKGTSATLVSLTGDTFEPATVTVKAGSTVRWTWGGSHNILSGSACDADGKFNSGAPSPSNGSTFEHTFESAGTFEYFCAPHCGAGAVGTVIVE
jgi:plastocyanin